MDANSKKIEEKLAWEAPAIIFEKVGNTYGGISPTYVEATGGAVS
jgi:hypothetical protein